MRLVDLTEGRDAQLFHATRNINDAMKIIASNSIEGRSEQQFKEKVLKGVSLTRSKHFALKWAGSGVVFVLDQAALSHNHKLIPIDFFSLDSDRAQNIKNGNDKYQRRKGSYSEAEEFVVGSINDLNKYLISVSFDEIKVRRILDNHMGLDADLVRGLLEHPLKNKVTL